jgi:hypothetical protein
MKQLFMKLHKHHWCNAKFRGVSMASICNKKMIGSLHRFGNLDKGIINYVCGLI